MSTCPFTSFIICLTRINLSDPSKFPVAVHNDEPGWKIDVSYDMAKQEFTLRVNGIEFKNLLFQATTQPEGPQTINCGSIEVNGERINPNVDGNYGF